MFHITTALQYCVDSVFPPTEEMRIVRRTTPDDIRIHALTQCSTGVITLTQYQKTLIHTLVREAKYHRNTRACELLAVLLIDHMTTGTDEQPVCVPIPLSRARLRERGYNQVELIARRAVAELPNLTIAPQLLQKKRHTKPQTTLSRKERLTNLFGAFAVMPHDVPLDTPLILLDDITTTGSTLQEAKKTLQGAGFTNIQCIAIAKA